VRPPMRSSFMYQIHTKTRTHTHAHTHSHTLTHTRTYARARSHTHTHPSIHPSIYLSISRQKDRQVGRQADRQIDKQTDRQTYLLQHLVRRSGTRCRTTSWSIMLMSAMCSKSSTCSTGCTAPLCPRRPLASAHTHTFPTTRPQLSELLLRRAQRRLDAMPGQTTASDETVQVQRASDGQFGVHIQRRRSRRHRSRHLLPRHCRWRVCFAWHLFCRNRHTNPLAL
jgi:hypothetical protein